MSTCAKSLKKLPILLRPQIVCEGTAGMFTVLDPRTGGNMLDAGPAVTGRILCITYTG